MTANKNYYLKKFFCVIASAVLSALFIVILFFCAPQISAVPEAEGEISYTLGNKTEEGYYVTETAVAEIGKDLTAVRINDLGELGKITKVNYIADRFVAPGYFTDDLQIVDLNKPFEFAAKGTLIFVILNLDPWAENFYGQAEALDKYKIGDNWHFTVSLPKIFCASNVYLRTKLVAQHGTIEDYDFIEFTTSYDKRTEKFTAQTENTAIDIDFYTRRQAMENAYNSAQIIMVHYQSTGSAFSGIADCPVIGTASSVGKVVQHSENLLIAFAILAAVVLAVFSALSVLKRTRKYSSAIVWIFGIALLLLSRFFLAQTTGAPLMWTAFWLASSFIILAGALLSIGRNFGKAPVNYVCMALVGVGAFLAFIRAFVPFGAAAALGTVCTVIKGVGTAALFAFVGLSMFTKNGGSGIMNTACAAMIAVALFASLFMPQIYPAYCNPIFWLCAVTVIATFISVFILFKETEKANAYLTANLHLEVERQVKDIKSVIAERDNLLQFVSHDMKKPLVSGVALLDTVISREKDGEQIKALQIVKQNTACVVSNLSEVGEYARFNYIAEPSQVVDLNKLCAELHKFHLPDCNANGIILKNAVDKSCTVFVKRQGLENVISNIIMNAVEHANCSVITLSVRRAKNKAVLCIADDGKGVTPDIDVFKPYVSENKPETGGVGLYICKNIIESMNGTLTYESRQGNTVFSISLLKA